MLWHPREPDEAEQKRYTAIESRGLTLGLGKPLIADLASFGVAELAPISNLYRSHVLFAAAAVAIELNCTKVVWPLSAGDTSSELSVEVDRASLVQSLLELGVDQSRVFIDLPLVDLSDRKLLELADDSGLPMAQFWPCEKAGARPCGTCMGCQRWQHAFRDIGIPWPWALQAVS